MALGFSLIEILRQGTHQRAVAGCLAKDPGGPRDVIATGSGSAIGIQLVSDRMGNLDLADGREIGQWRGC